MSVLTKGAGLFDGQLVTDVVMVRAARNLDAANAANGLTVYGGTAEFVTPPAPTGTALPIKPPPSQRIYFYDGIWKTTELPWGIPPRGYRYILNMSAPGRPTIDGWGIFPL
jgi:hypothetical protein